MLNGHTGLVKVLAGCTSKDLCINKLFKFILRKCWEDHVVKVMKDVGDEANNNPSFKLSSPTRQNIVDWVHWGYVFLQESRTMIQLFFEVWGITTTNPGLVHNYNFFKKIMADVEDSEPKTYLKTKRKYFLFNFCIQYWFVFVPFC